MPQSIASNAFVADTNRLPAGMSEHDRRAEFDLRRRERYDSFSNYLTVPATPTPTSDPIPPNHDRSCRSDASHPCGRDGRGRDATETDHTAVSPDPPQRTDSAAHPVVAKTAQRPAGSNLAAVPETKSGAELIQPPSNEPRRQIGKPTESAELPDIFQSLAVKLTTVVANGPSVGAGSEPAPAYGSDSGPADTRLMEHELLAGSERAGLEFELLTEFAVTEHQEPLDKRAELVEHLLAGHRRAPDSGMAPSVHAEELRDTEPQLAADISVDTWDPQHGSADAESHGDDSSGHWSEQDHPSLWSHSSPGHDPKSRPSLFSTTETNGLDPRQQPDEATRNDASRPRSYRIALDSPELGRLTLRVHDQQGIRAHLIAQNEAAYQTLAGAMEDARQFLQDAGVSLAEFSLSHGQHHQTHQQVTPDSSTTSSGTESSEPLIRPTTAWSGRLNVLA